MYNSKMTLTFQYQLEILAVVSLQYTEEVLLTHLRFYSHLWLCWP